MTGNNDADGPYLLQWVRERMPQWEAPLRERLVAWGGNSSGVNVANIDNLGSVHPDTMWWHHDLGSVRQRPFSHLVGHLRAADGGPQGQARARWVGAAPCHYFEICGGNTRVRAQQLTGDAWAEDPGCYLRRRRDRPGLRAAMRSAWRSRRSATAAAPLKSIRSRPCVSACTAGWPAPKPATLGAGLLWMAWTWPTPNLHLPHDDRPVDASGAVPAALRFLPWRAAHRRHGPGAAAEAWNACAAPRR